MRTHEQAELEIATLRAQLARREAELEACIAHKDHATLLTSAVHAENMPAQSLHRTAVASGFTVEEVEDILGMRASKNREMELQIKHLSEKVRSIYMPLWCPLMEVLRSSSKLGCSPSMRQSGGMLIRATPLHLNAGPTSLPNHPIFARAPQTTSYRPSP